MSFIKLDHGILDSSLWFDRDAKDVFLTALLMAKPVELTEAQRQLEVLTMAETGFEVSPGWYGLVSAAGVGIVNRSQLSMEPGMSALERLGKPEPNSRSSEFEGRRLVRISGGYIVLNFIKYRDKDHTAAVRAKRYRMKKEKAKAARKPKFLNGPLPGETAYVRNFKAGLIDSDGAPILSE